MYDISKHRIFHHKKCIKKKKKWEEGPGDVNQTKVDNMKIYGCNLFHSECNIYTFHKNTVRIVRVHKMNTVNIPRAFYVVTVLTP